MTMYDHSVYPPRRLTAIELLDLRGVTKERAPDAVSNQGHAGGEPSTSAGPSMPDESDGREDA